MKRLTKQTKTHNIQSEARKHRPIDLIERIMSQKGIICLPLRFLIRIPPFSITLIHVSIL